MAFHVPKASPSSEELYVPVDYAYFANPMFDHGKQFHNDVTLTKWLRTHELYHWWPKLQERKKKSNNKKFDRHELIL